MFSLIFGFYNMMFSKPDVHVLIVGLDHAGKSTLLERVKGSYSRDKGLPPEKITPTIGMNLAKFKLKGTQYILWDLGGQLKMRAIWERYYSEANAVVFVVDAADRSRLEDAYIAYCGVCASSLLQDVPIIILANKQDVDGAATLQEIASLFFSNSETQTTPHRLFGVSALTGQGVKEAVETMCSEGRWHVQHLAATQGDMGV